MNSLNNIINKLRHFEWLSLFNQYTASKGLLPPEVLLVLYYLSIKGHCDSLAQKRTTKAPVLDSLDKLGLIENDLRNPYIFSDAQNGLRRYTLTNLGIQYIQYAFPKMHIHNPKKKVYDISQYVKYIMFGIIGILIMGLLVMTQFPRTRSNLTIAVRLTALLLVLIFTQMAISYYHDTKHPRLRMKDMSDLMFFLDLCEDSRNHDYIYMPYVTKLFYNKFLSYGQRIHQSDLAKFLIQNDQQDTISISNNEYDINLIKNYIFNKNDSQI